MNRVIQLLRSRRVGLALSGGSVRGLAHIGVIKALAELGIRPAVIAGTSAGSIVGAGVAAGLEWHEIASIARSIFWPSLLHGERLERFCEKHFPETFAHLPLPFAALATALPSKQVIAITEGHLASAISASCALRVIRRPVVRAGSV
jgi:NTE family protein